MDAAAKKYRHRVDRYAAAVISGAIVAGPLVRRAGVRHLADRDEALARGWRFDVGAADQAIGFFESALWLPDADRPFLLAEWQAFVIGSLFGWVHVESGARRFREAFVEIGKGNGKTPMAAGIGLFGLLMGGEQAPEVYSAATSAHQARICWRDAYNMATRSPELAGLVRPSANNLAFEFGFFRPVSSEHKGLDGLRPSVAILDEFQEHPSGTVAHKLRAGAKGRPNFLALEITNSGFDRTSICWSHHEHSRRVLEGLKDDDRWFAYVCGLDDGDDPLTDRVCHIKANPNLGRSVSREYLDRQVENAKNLPQETNTVLRLNFCVWTQAISRFFDLGKWQTGADAIPVAELVNVPAYGGLDLGQTDDLSAFVVRWVHSAGLVPIRAKFWAPEAARDARPDRPWEHWIREGLVKITPGQIVDYDIIREDVLELARAWGVREIGYDKRFARQLAGQLEGDGLTMVDTPQGFGLHEALTAIGDHVKTGKVRHGGDPVLAWMADNVVVRQGRLGQIRLDKEASREKIDGIVAWAMAEARVVAAAPAEVVSIYATRGVLTIGGKAPRG